MKGLGIFFIIVAIACGIMAGSTVIAEEEVIRGWLVVGAIFFVIGLICIAAGGTRKVQVVQTTPAAHLDKPNLNDFKICPDCAEEVKKEAKICRFCKYTFKTK